MDATLNSVKYYINKYDIKTPDTFKEFLEVNKDKNFEYCNTNNRLNKIIYKNLVFRKIKSFKEEIQKYYGFREREPLMFNDYFIRFKIEGNFSNNYVKTIQKLKEILNIKYIYKNNDLLNEYNMINDIIIDEGSLYLLLGYNKWKVQREIKNET